MTLTPRIDRLPDGRLKGFFEELPGIFYLDDTEEVLSDRLFRLARAMSSPHIRIKEIQDDGDVVLELARQEDEPPALSPTAPLTLAQAVRWGRKRPLREQPMA